MGDFPVFYVPLPFDNYTERGQHSPRSLACRAVLGAVHACSSALLPQTCEHVR